METILVPTDFSTCADNALQYANELAHHLHARLVLFHSIFIPDTAPALLTYGDLGEVAYLPSVKDPAYEESQRKKLEALQQMLYSSRAYAATQYENRIRYGWIKDTLWPLAKEEEVDLVVMGTEGAYGFEEMVWGSNAADALESMKCPLFIIPQAAKYQPFQRIVFATDLQGEPYVDVNLVLKLANLYDAEILFLHLLSKKNEEGKEEAQAEMNKLCKALPYYNVSFATLPAEDIEQGIRRFAQKHQADLLVMGHHPHGFWQHVFQKDHAKTMAFHTSLPLLILPYKN